MTSLSFRSLRVAIAVALAAWMIVIQIRPAVAADSPSTGNKTKTAAAAAPAAEATAEGAESPAPAAAEQPHVQLQLDDEVPADSENQSLLRRRPSASPATEDERPLWKNWIFWTVTGALAIGAISLVAYTTSKHDSSLAPCPPDIVYSLGCYGAGR